MSQGRGGGPAGTGTRADLAGASLDSFDTILIGVRAYAVRADLKTFNQRLLDYVRDGGVLIVQYQTPEFDGNYGPYPYTMTWGAEEVSEEDSPVAVLEPVNALFSSPNAITAKDFDGWVEERGSKFWKTWDERYTPLLKTHDRGQAPQRRDADRAPQEGRLRLQRLRLVPPASLRGPRRVSNLCEPDLAPPHARDSRRGAVIRQLPVRTGSDCGKCALNQEVTPGGPHA